MGSNKEDDLKPGHRVRMTQAHRTWLAQGTDWMPGWGSGNQDHEAEFGYCVGVVLGPVDYNACLPGDPEHDPWEPSGLRYAYDPSQLEPVS